MTLHVPPVDTPQPLSPALFLEAGKGGPSGGLLARERQEQDLTPVLLSREHTACLPAYGWWEALDPGAQTAAPRPLCSQQELAFPFPSFHLPHFLGRPGLARNSLRPPCVQGSRSSG